MLINGGFYGESRCSPGVGVNRASVFVFAGNGWAYERSLPLMYDNCRWYDFSRWEYIQGKIERDVKNGLK